jgi:hypothetical protein
MRWYVTSKKSNDTRDGRSLDTAFRRILHAIHMAVPDDTIVIEPGVYDQDLAKRIGAARAAGVSVAVAGSEVEGAGGRQRGRQSAKAP